MMKILLPQKKRKFTVTGVENFDVIPLQKGKEYVILEVSKDGFKWKARDSKGRIGWIPAHYCRALDPEQFPVPGHVAKVDHKKVIMQMQDPTIKSAASDLLSFLDNPETYLPTAPSKPREDYTKTMFRAVEPGTGKGIVMRQTKEEEKPKITQSTANSANKSDISNGPNAQKKPVQQKPVQKKPEDINDLSVNHFPEPKTREPKKNQQQQGGNKNVTGKAESGVDVQYGKGVDLSHVDMSGKSPMKK